MILYNPHIDDFLGEAPHFWMLRRRSLKKYGFLINEMIKSKRPLRILLDAELSAFIPISIFQRLPSLIRKAICGFEFGTWCRLNNLTQSQYRLIYPQELRRDDTVFAFSYKAACGDFKRRLANFNRCNTVIFHLSHYFVATREKSDNMKLLTNVYLAGDSDISENSYFKKYFSWYQRPFLVLPFAIHPRFTARIPFVDRDKRCLATGSFHNLAFEKPAWKFFDYMSSSGLTTYHPLRKEIFEGQKNLTSLIVSHISPYRSYHNGNRIRRIFSHLNVSQKSYFAQDIVSLYNHYRYAVVGEEWSGFPAIGALEAIACGAVLVANPTFYKGLEIQPNVHFLPHNGTLSGLLTVLEDIDFETASALHANGRQFVLKNFNPSSCYKRWLKVLKMVSTCNQLGGAE